MSLGPNLLYRTADYSAVPCDGKAVPTCKETNLWGYRRTNFEAIRFVAERKRGDGLAGSVIRLLLACTNRRVGQDCGCSVSQALRKLFVEEEYFLASQSSALCTGRSFHLGLLATARRRTLVTLIRNIVVPDRRFKVQLFWWQRRWLCSRTQS